MICIERSCSTPRDTHARLQHPSAAAPRLTEEERRPGRTVRLPCELASEARTPEDSVSETMIRVEHRESLAYALSEAAELEQGLMCRYLYAAFSIGRRREQRHPPEQAAAIARW